MTKTIKKMILLVHINLYQTRCFMKSINFYFSLTIDNMARGKAASQSGSLLDYSTADKAVDGNRNSRLEEGSCAHPSELHVRQS